MPVTVPIHRPGIRHRCPQPTLSGPPLETIKPRWRRQNGAAISNRYSALFLGINEFRRREQAEALLAEQERRRRGRRHVISAVLRLVQRDGLGEDDACETLRRGAMRVRLGIEDYCEMWMQRAGDACGPSAAITREKRDHA